MLYVARVAFTVLIEAPDVDEARDILATDALCGEASNICESSRLNEIQIEAVEALPEGWSGIEYPWGGDGKLTASDLLTL